VFLDFETSNLDKFVWNLELPGQTGSKKIHRRVRREVFIFYYKLFLLCDLCALCGEKNSLPEKGKILPHDFVV
jgi:hypothetical protein